jgi:hypothetical protein
MFVGRRSFSSRRHGTRHCFEIPASTRFSGLKPHPSRSNIRTLASASSLRVTEFQINFSGVCGGDRIEVGCIIVSKSQYLTRLEHTCEPWATMGRRDSHGYSGGDRGWRFLVTTCSYLESDTSTTFTQVTAKLQISLLDIVVITESFAP